MPTVLARPALIDDLPAIVGLLADDVLGQGRENIGPPLHSDYFDAFEAIDDDPNQILVVFEAEGVIIRCLQLSFRRIAQLPRGVRQVAGRAGGSAPGQAFMG